MAGHDILRNVGTITDGGIAYESTSARHLYPLPQLHSRCGTAQSEMPIMQYRARALDCAVEQKPGKYAPAVRTQRLLEGPERWRAATSAAVLAGPPGYSKGMSVLHITYKWDRATSKTMRVVRSSTARCVRCSLVDHYE